jgi:hypothetical protein
MRGFRTVVASVAVAAAFLVAPSAHAQWPDETGEPVPQPQPQPAPQPQAQPAPEPQAQPAPRGEASGPRLAFQSRLVASFVGVFEPAFTIIQPSVAVGARIMDDRVFLGMGVGLFGIQDFFNAVTLQPTINVDLLRRGLAALYLVGWVPIGVVVEKFGDERDTLTLLGANAGLGLRAQVHDNVAIGAEWGWGFGLLFWDGDNEFFHGSFGALMLEISFGL